MLSQAAFSDSQTVKQQCPLLGLVSFVPHILQFIILRRSYY